MKENNRCCAACRFYGVNEQKEKVCEDYDGLYFLCQMEPHEHCPDFIEKKTHTKKFDLQPVAI